MNWRRKSKDRDLEEEIAFDLAADAAERLHAGDSPQQAARASRKDFGNVLLVKESTREMWGWAWLERFGQDARYALRQLARSPGFAAVAVLSLALGIGANTAIFTLIDVVMLKSLPVAHPEDLVWLIRNSTDGKGRFSFPHALWEQIRDHQDMFAGLFAYGSTNVDLSAGGESRRVPVALVSGDFFSALGVGPALGRVLTPADDQRGCPAIAVISHAFWQSEYGGSESVLGRSIALDGRAFQIAGVAAPSFFGVEFGYHVPLWAPLCAEAALVGPGRSGVNSNMGRVLIGRPKTGVTLDQLRARLNALAPPLLAAAQQHNTTLAVLPFSKGLPDLERNYGEALLFLMAVVGVVLLIACANVANLLLARAAARQHEMAVRLALGAGRRRLIRQLLTESIILSLAGAAVGVLFARWGSRVLGGFMVTPQHLAAFDLSPDARVLAFTLAAGILTGVLFGLVPAWRAVRVDPNDAIKTRGRGDAGARSRFRAGKVLVVAQVALSLIAVVGAGLLLGSWRRLAAIDPGFRSGGVLLAAANIRAARVPPAERAVLYRRTILRLRAIPGVVAASAASRTPMGRTNWNAVLDFPESGAGGRAQLNQVSESYFASIGTPILAGRDFTVGDVAKAPEVAIVNQELARRFLGGASAIGRHFRFPTGGSFSAPIEIVGIAANTKESALDEPTQPIAYFALNQDPAPGQSFNFVLRTAGQPATLVPGVKAALAEIEPRFSFELTTLEQQVDASVKLPRTLGMLAGFFGALALLLASVGLYGIMAYTVTRRRNEIGVRIALGAPRSRVICMVLGDVGRMTAAGVVLGILLSLPVMKLMSKFLFRVQPGDPATLAAAALILGSVAIAAAIAPARRAARLDPMVTLRED